MSKYFKKERLKENTIMVATEDAARRKEGDFIRISYLMDRRIGYEFQENDFSECGRTRFLKETRFATIEEIELFKKGKLNLNEKKEERNT